MDELSELKRKLREFAEARDWEKFHNPKNLAMALAAECGELLEIFQWRSGEESGQLDVEMRHRVEDELADILIYLVRMADRTDIDLLAAAHAKMKRNESRYPAERVRGQALKYDEY
ncbi:MAG: nucleotide pyrophosphohydrolase [Steroidobacteraceae bacterium]